MLGFYGGVNMRSILYATTALVAVGAFIGAAQADEMMAEPVSVGVGGYYRVAVGSYSDDNNTGQRGHTIQQNIEINISGETILDNGLTAGVNVWLDGNVGFQDDTSETRVYLSGGFGTLTAGAFESAAQLGTVWAPGGNGNFGVKSQYFSPGGGASWQGIIGSNEDDLTVMYSSPDFNGFSFSASYAPEDQKESYADRATGEPNDISETTAFSLNMSMPVMGGSVSGGVGYETGTVEVCTAMCDATSIRGGVVVSIDDLSIGGAILEIDNQGKSTTHSDFGIGWTQGSLSLGIQYGSVDADMSNDITAFNAAYALGPGIQLNSQIAMGSNDDAAAGDWTQFLLGTTISF